MKSIRYMKPGLKLLDLPEPQITGEDMVKIRIAYSGICGTDAHFAKGDFDNMISDEQLPFELGHEASGVVVELGRSATQKGLKVGDKVSYYFNYYCNNCYYCRNGQEHMCANKKGYASAMSEYIVVHEQQVYKLPDDMDLRRAALTEPVSVALHGFDLCRVIPGKRVAVSGGGGIGLLHMQLARLAGATHITVIEPVKEKRELALKLGADHVIDPFNEDVKAKALEFTGGLLYDAVLEASGAPGACRPAYDIVANCGVIEFFALYHNDFDFPLNLMNAFWRELTVIGGVMQSPYVFPRTVALLPKLELEPYTRAIFEPEEFEIAFQTQYSAKYPKVMFHFSD